MLSRDRPRDPPCGRTGLRLFNLLGSREVDNYRIAQVGELSHFAYLLDGLVGLSELDITDLTLRPDCFSEYDEGHPTSNLSTWEAAPHGFVGQPGLADARLAAEQEQPAASADSAIYSRADFAKRPFAANEAFTRLRRPAFRGPQHAQRR